MVYVIEKFNPGDNSDQIKKSIEILLNCCIEVFDNTIIKPNFHELLHFVDCIENYGNLSEYSTFHFESLNGLLSKFFNGTKKIHLQIAKRYIMNILEY